MVVKSGQALEEVTQIAVCLWRCSDPARQRPEQPAYGEPERPPKVSQASVILQHAINLRKLFEMDFYPEPGSNLIQVKVTKPGEKTPAHLFVSFYQQYSNFPSIPSKKN